MPIDAARIFEVGEGLRLRDRRDVMDSYLCWTRCSGTLLAVVLEREPLQGALHSEDGLLCGLGLVYLEGVLWTG